MMLCFLSINTTASTQEKYQGIALHPDASFVHNLRKNWFLLQGKLLDCLQNNVSVRNWNYCWLSNKNSSYLSVTQQRRMRFSTCLRQIGHSDMRSPHIWHVPCPQRKIMFFRRSKQTGHIVCSLMSCSCCCNFCMSELDVSRLPLFIRHTGSTGTPPVKQSSRHVTQWKWENIHKHHTYRSQNVRGTQQLKLFYLCA